MSNTWFQFKQFTIQQDRCAMKVTTDACLFGAWVAGRVRLALRSFCEGGSQESGSLPAGRQVGSQISGTGSVLDVGTGTGLLSLMIAQQCNADITTVEIDAESFEQASENITASPWAGRIKNFHADSRRFEFSNTYDVIISNPPFYENELKGGNIKKNLAHHSEGLLLPELLTIIKKNLKSDGTFYLLLPFKRNEEIRKLLIEHEFFILQMVFVRQSVNHNFFRIMLAGKLKTDEVVETKIDEISIKNEQDQYTAIFADLLKDYYLHL